MIRKFVLVVFCLIVSGAVLAQGTPRPVTFSAFSPAPSSAVSGRPIPKSTEPVVESVQRPIVSNAANPTIAIYVEGIGRSGRLYEKEVEAVAATIFQNVGYTVIAGYEDPTEYKTRQERGRMRQPGTEFTATVKFSVLDTGDANIRTRDWTTSSGRGRNRSTWDRVKTDTTVRSKSASVEVTLQIVHTASGQIMYAQTHVEGARINFAEVRILGSALRSTASPEQQAVRQALKKMVQKPSLQQEAS